jgi:hypothetical protein
VILPPTDAVFQSRDCELHGVVVVDVEQDVTSSAWAILVSLCDVRVDNLEAAAKRILEKGLELVELVSYSGEYA